MTDPTREREDYDIHHSAYLGDGQSFLQAMYFLTANTVQRTGVP